MAGYYGELLNALRTIVLKINKYYYEINRRALFIELVHLYHSNS